MGAVIPSNERIVDDWRELAVGRGNAFLLPEWLGAWARNYGGQPVIATARGAGGSLSGIAPLLRTGKMLRFAGSSLGDRFGLAAAERDESRVAEAIAAILERGDYLVLDNIERGAIWPEQVREYAGRRLHRVVTRVEVLPRIDLEGQTWEGFLGSRSRNFRSQVRRKTRALGRGVDVAYRQTKAPHELSQDMDTLFNLHDARWKPRGGSGIASDLAREFHRDFAAALLHRGWLRLWFLELDGEAVAAWYGWNVGGRYSFYQGGFAPQWGDKSVGFVLMAHTVRAAIREGASEYDLLRGGESYKSRFATSQPEVETLVLAPSVSRARALAELETAARRLTARLPDPFLSTARHAYQAAGRWMPTNRSS